MSKGLRKPWMPTADFSQSPTVYRFVMDRSPVSIIKGPVGSGKTYGCCIKPWVCACEQLPSPRDGLRYVKLGVVRNTIPELRRTTMETWRAVFPEKETGTFRETSPISQHIKIPSFNWEYGVPFGQNKGFPGLDFKIDFFALDRPEDVKALLSYECTMLYFNEIREIPKAIVDMAQTRIGRYPSVAKNGVNASWYGIMGDTNPVDDDHWLHVLEYEEQPDGWKFFTQPPGVLEAEETDRGYIPKEQPYKSRVVVTKRENVQYAAQKFWVVNPDAENLKHLPVPEGQSPLSNKGYYLQFIAGKDFAWIQCYAQGKDVYVREGRAVIPEFNIELHVVDNLPLFEGVPVEGGFDIGGGTVHPAGVYGQRHPQHPIYLVHDEISIPEIGLKRFAQTANAQIARIFPNYEFDKFWSDPAGAQMDPILETVAFDHLRAQGLPAFPAYTNDVQVRIEALKQPFTQLIPETKTPRILIHKRCKTLIKGLNGAWCYRRLQVPGESRYESIPSKNEYSHVCEALGYWILGGGEIRRMNRSASFNRPKAVHIAKTDFDVFDT